ncbi:hypothetical protein [Xenorhabdus khoisanae]|nr:hypothetical protein [Xenorhabdus khoisanae]
MYKIVVYRIAQNESVESMKASIFTSQVAANLHLFLWHCEFFSIAQKATLTGQKLDMWCNETWINGIWLGEGAGGTLPYGLP